MQTWFLKQSIHGRMPIKAARYFTTYVVVIDTKLRNTS